MPSATVVFAACATPTPEPAPRHSPGKGRQTHAVILDAALGLASHMGLEGLSIGALAELTGMSKSGVFAHFGSREELQIAVVREYHARFEAEVFAPAMTAPRGLPRLRALFERWLERVSQEIDSGCIYISGAVEFDDRPGAVRDALAQMVRAWHRAMERAIVQAVEQGHLPPDTDTLIKELDRMVPPARVSGPVLDTDVRELVFMAGRRDIVDQLIRIRDKELHGHP